MIRQKINCQLFWDWLIVSGIFLSHPVVHSALGLQFLKQLKAPFIVFTRSEAFLKCMLIQSKYSTFHVCPCWEHETSCVGSLGIPSGVSCPSAGACTLDCVAANGAGPRRHHCAYQCWSGSLPEPWGLGGCLGGAPNTWMETRTRHGREEMV